MSQRAIARVVVFAKASSKRLARTKDTSDPSWRWHHKMLREIYAMLSKNTHYVDKTLDDKALMVARNATRWQQMLVK